MEQKLREIVNGRIRLTLAKVADAARILDYIETQGEGAHVSICNLSFFSETITIERQRDYLRRKEISPTDYLYLIETNEEGKGILLGTVGLHEHDIYNDNARLGVLLFPESRSSSFGTDAIYTILNYGFEQLKLNKVYLIVFVKNSKAASLYVKMGFMVEGILREHYKLKDKDGTGYRYYDMYNMSILRREWKK